MVTFVVKDMHLLQTTAEMHGGSAKENKQEAVDPPDDPGCNWMQSNCARQIMLRHCQSQ